MELILQLCGISFCAFAIAYFADPTHDMVIYTFFATAYFTLVVFCIIERIETALCESRGICRTPLSTLLFYSFV